MPSNINSAGEAKVRVDSFSGSLLRPGFQPTGNHATSPDLRRDARANNNIAAIANEPKKASDRQLQFDSLLTNVTIDSNSGRCMEIPNPAAFDTELSCAWTLPAPRRSSNEASSWVLLRAFFRFRTLGKSWLGSDVAQGHIICSGI